VKAIACSLPRSQGVPLSRFSRAELHRLVIERGVCEASAATIARWLREDALKPWQHRSWIVPSDPAFLEKAGPVLDLYQGRWQGKLLHPGEFVICADEKPSIQARARIYETLPPAPHTRGQRVEHTYQRRGALTYLAALDIGRRGGRRPRVFGRSEARGGIDPFDRLVWQVMTKEPYASARRVFWIVDNGSSHRGQKAVQRLERRWPNLVLVHLPPAGSTRSRSTTRSCSGSCSSQTTSPTSPNSPAPSTPSSTTGTRSPNRSTGASPATTSPR
jgi:hypothetical protein